MILKFLLYVLITWGLAGLFFVVAFALLYIVNGRDGEETEEKEMKRFMNLIIGFVYTVVTKQLAVVVGYDYNQRIERFNRYNAINGVDRKLYGINIQMFAEETVKIRDRNKQLAVVYDNPDELKFEGGEQKMRVKEIIKKFLNLVLNYELLEDIDRPGLSYEEAKTYGAMHKYEVHFYERVLLEFFPEEFKKINHFLVDSNKTLEDSIKNVRDYLIEELNNFETLENYRMMVYEKNIADAYEGVNEEYNNKADDDLPY